MRASRNVPRPPAIPRDVAGERAQPPDASEASRGLGERTEDSTVHERHPIRGAALHEVEASAIDEHVATRVGPRPEPPPGSEPAPELQPQAPARVQRDVLVRSSELAWCEEEQTQQWSALACEAEAAAFLPGSAPLVASLDAPIAPECLPSPEAAPGLELDALLVSNVELTAQDAERTRASVELVSRARQRLTGASELAGPRKKSRGHGARALWLGLAVHLVVTVSCVYFAWVSPLQQFIAEQRRRHELGTQQHARALAELEALRARERQAFEVELSQLRSQLALAHAAAAPAADGGAAHAAKARRGLVKSGSHVRH